MKKEEYMGALKSALNEFDEELTLEIISDYEERFRIGREKGKTEEEVIRELGSIKDLVDELGEMQRESGDNTGKRMKTTGTFQLVAGEQKKEEQREEQEEEQEKQNYGSGTYYKEKSFSESFDAAMKKFGKALDGVMKEAGRIIGEAAEQFEMRMEEAKKNRQYTYNGDGTFEGSEKDADAEPSVEQSGSGAEGCRRVIVDADIADVKIRTTELKEPKAVCHYYSHKTAMLYPFHAYQEGDTFYVGVQRQQNQECKSGFFQFSMSPSVEIELQIPKGLDVLELDSISGDMDLSEVCAGSLKTCSKSGDIRVNYLTGTKCHMESLSGDLSLAKSEVKEAELATKSGDCMLDKLQAATVAVNTASGNLVARGVQAESMQLGTMSGDMVADDVQTEAMKASTASGDLCLTDCRGSRLTATSASGDISVKADFTEYQVKTQSGELHLESRHDADMEVNSTSGDVMVELIEAKEKYRLELHSVSGDCRSNGYNGRESAGEEGRRITAKSISGDVTVRFL